MSTAARLVKLVEGLDADGVLSATKGGTGNTTGGGTSSPTISQIAYGGDDTAANPAGGQTITLTGTNFAQGAKVLINTTQVSVVSVVSATQITFTAPQLAAGSYILYVVNTNGSTAIAVPGIQVSGVPAWTTAAGTLGTVYETAAIATTVAATSDSAVTYSVISGALPSGATLAANGTISGTSPVTASSTTYTFTVRANDAENQETDRTFNLTINPDVVTWSSPANAAALTGTPGVAYSSALSAASAAGQTVSYSANALPAGLAISGSTITGTPTTAGTSSTTLTATAANTNRTAQVTISWTITVAADAYFPLTTLLLNSETAALPFTADASANNFAVTVVGDTKPNNFNPYTPGYYSTYLATSSDGYSYSDTTTGNFGTGDFTVELWVYPTASAHNFIMASPATSSWEIITYGDQLYWHENGGNYGGVGYGTVPKNQWVHLAASRTGGFLNLYINGTRVLNSANTYNYSGTSTRQIGITTAPQWISNLRIIKGTGIYSGTTITVPTSPLTAVTNTSLLTCQSNRMIDNSANAVTFTTSGSPAVQSFVPFQPNTSYAAYGSTYFDGTGDYLSSTNAGFAFGTNSFTIEGWVYSTGSVINNGIFQLAATVLPNSISGLGLAFFGTSSSFTWLYAGGQVNFGPTPIANTWYHFALSRSGTSLKFFLNGILVGTVADSTNYTQTGLAIGSYYGTGSVMTGYISNFRMVNGTALYTTNFTPATTPLTTVTNTSLLTCQTNQPVNNQTFLDNSTSALPITRSGNATQGSFAPYGANWSNYFNGTGDYLSVPITANGSLDLSSTDYTIEMYFNAASFIAGTENNILSLSSNSAAPYLQLGFYRTTNSFFAEEATQASVRWTLSTSTVPTLNSWTHVALVRSGSGTNNIKLYVNGIMAGSVTYAPVLQTFELLNVGALKYNGGYRNYANAYISNLRVVKGTALYTTTFTPPTAPLIAVSGTSLLTCQSPNFTDNSLNAFAITPGGTPSTQKFNPFATVTQTPNTYSTYFDGSGDYLTVPFNSALNMGTGNFTIEFWVRTTSTAAYATALRLGDTWTTGSWALYLNDAGGSGIPSWWSQTGPYTLSTSGATINDGLWHHIALVRNTTTMTMYIDGTSRGTLSVSTNSVGDTTTQLWIGRDASNVRELAGYISNLRIVKGTALYTTTFTPPTTALTAVANTSLLTCQSSTVIDNSTNNFALTAFGDAVPRRQNPFGFTTSSTQDYSTTTFGGSTYFDGSSDYLSIPNSALHATLPGNFTAECWFYLNNVAGTQLIFSHRTNGYCPFLIWASTTSLLLYVSSDNGSWNVINGDSIATVAAGQWYHLAYTRTGSTFRVFLNGIQVKTFSSSASFTTPNSLQLGMSTTETSTALNGYISDFRFVNGTGVYTSNFVPPQAPLTAVTNTTLLLNMDKAAVADKSGKAVLECVGDAKVSTAVKKYGSASMYFDGTGDHALSQSIVPLGSGDFTFEMWIYPLDTGTRHIVSFPAGWSPANGISIIQYGGNYATSCGASGNANAGQAVEINGWHHIALVRNNTSVKFYYDGVLKNTATDSTNLTGTAISLGYIVPGASSSWGSFNGYMDDVRITRGYARYTANFTPSTTTLLTK